MDPYELSAVLFGRKQRLPLAVWVMQRDDPTFYLSAVVTATGIGLKDVRDELARLDRIGMVQKLDRDRGNERQYYLRNDLSPLWDVVNVAHLAVGQKPRKKAPDYFGSG